jgi:GDPmannose 4,6-dehydratase
VDLLIGDASKAKAKLGWSPRCTLEEMVQEMIDADLDAFRREIHLKKGGYNVLRQKE